MRRAYEDEGAFLRNEVLPARRDLAEEDIHNEVDEAEDGSADAGRREGAEKGSVKQGEPDADEQRELETVRREPGHPDAQPNEVLQGPGDGHGDPGEAAVAANPKCLFGL